MRASGRDKVQDYADKFGCEFFPGQKPWGVKVDVAMPCATQNEINMDEAKKIVGEKNRQHMLGKKHSEETREKMSKIRKGKYVHRQTDILNAELAFKIKQMLVNS